MASKDSMGGATSKRGKADHAKAGDGGVRSSDDPMPDLLWAGELLGEQRDATCSAGMKRSEGRGDGPQGLPAPKTVRKLQIILYGKAKSKPKYRFWSLYGEVQRSDVLAAAWQRVKANAGGPGVDGVTIEELVADAEVEAAWLSALQRELKSKKYRPAPVKRVTIPKASGGFRLLGVPTLKDRVAQMAVYLVLMPIFEADFHPRSYGYRPKRSARDAVEEIREGLRTGRTEVVDADLTQFFDRIPHRQLMRLVARRVSDGSVLKLIKAWLRAPILEENESGARRLAVNPCGTPQGGVISPLLANIYLNPLDHAVNENSGPQPQMIRYADDLVILCPPGKGQETKERLARWLQAKGLSLNEKKTQVVNNRESGFEFLGFSFRWQKSSKGTNYLRTEPSEAAKQSLRDKVWELTQRKCTWRAQGEVVREINQVTRGWSNYFALAHYQRTFGQMNYFVAKRLRRWLWRKHGSPTGQYKRWPDETLFESYGLYKMQTASYN